jgi:hypothetical protein
MNSYSFSVPSLESDGRIFGKCKDWLDSQPTGLMCRIRKNTAVLTLLHYRLGSSASVSFPS